MKSICPSDMSSACSAKRYADFRVVRAVPEQSKWPRRVVFLFAFTFDVPPAGVFTTDRLNYPVFHQILINSERKSVFDFRFSLPPSLLTGLQARLEVIKCPCTDFAQNSIQTIALDLELGFLCHGQA